MIEIHKVSKIDAIIARVDTVRMAGENYIDETKKQFAILDNIEFKEVEHFLKHFNWDDKLINVLFAQAISSKEALWLLKKKRFAYTLCENAGEAFCTDENFIVNLIVETYNHNTHRSRLLAKRFCSYLSESGIFCLLKNVGRDPKMSAVLNSRLQMAA